MAADSYELWITYQVLPPEDTPLLMDGVSGTPEQRRHLFVFPRELCEERVTTDGATVLDGPSIGHLYQAVRDHACTRDVVILRVRRPEI